MLHIDEPTACAEAFPELWFSNEPKKIAEAKRLCRACPFMLRCLNECIETEKLLGQRLRGIHGGLEPHERANLKMRRIA